MANVRSMDFIAQKWGSRAATAGDVYEAGVRQPKADWQRSAAGSQGSWEAGVADAARLKSFTKGVNAAGSQKWQAKTLSKGVSRFPQGIQESGPEFQVGFERYRGVIESTQLPPRFAKGDPRNIERVKTIAAALRKAKVGAG